MPAPTIFPTLLTPTSVPVFLPIVTPAPVCASLSESGNYFEDPPFTDDGAMVLGIFMILCAAVGGIVAFLAFCVAVETQTCTSVMILIAVLVGIPAAVLTGQSAGALDAEYDDQDFYRDDDDDAYGPPRVRVGCQLVLKRQYQGMHRAGICLWALEIAVLSLAALNHFVVAPRARRRAAEVQLVAEASAEAARSGGWAVHVTQLSGEKITFQCDAETTVRQLKLKILGKAGLPLDQQALVHEGTALTKDAQTVEAAGIQDGAQLHLLMQNPTAESEA